MAKKRIFSKIVWFSLSVILILVVLSAFSDEDGESQDKTQAEQSEEYQNSTVSFSQGLSIADFKFGDKEQKVFKTLKAKGYRPYDFDDLNTDRIGETFADRYFTEAYLYEKEDGKFEGLDSSYVVVSFDEFYKLAGIEVTLKNLKIDYSDFQNSLVGHLTEIDKKCIGGHGYVLDEKETKMESDNDMTFVYKNKNGDVCALHVTIPQFDFTQFDFNLTFISRTYLAAERLMFDAMNKKYHSF